MNKNCRYCLKGELCSKKDAVKTKMCKYFEVGNVLLDGSTLTLVQHWPL